MRERGHAEANVGRALSAGAPAVQQHRLVRALRPQADGDLGVGDGLRRGVVTDDDPQGSIGVRCKGRRAEDDCLLSAGCRWQRADEPGEGQEESDDQRDGGLEQPRAGPPQAGECLSQCVQEAASFLCTAQSRPDALFGRPGQAQFGQASRYRIVQVGLERPQAGQFVGAFLAGDQVRLDLSPLGVRHLAVEVGQQVGADMGTAHGLFPSDLLSHQPI